MRSFAIVLFFYLATLCFVSAQPYTYKSINYTSGSGSSFSVDEIKGCTPFTINISTDFATNGGSLTSNETGSSEVFIPNGSTLGTYTFNVPGTHILSFIQSAGIIVDQIEVTVFANPEPSFQVFTCINETYVKITDTNNGFDAGYQITYTNGIVSPVGQGSVDIHSLPGGSTYAIKVRGLHSGAANNCVDSIQSIPVLASFQRPNIDTLKIIDATEIDIKFDDQPFVPYTIDVERHDPTVKPYTAFASSVSNASGFYKVQSTIIKPDLGTNYYCFKISPENKCSGGVQTALASASLCTVNLQAVAADNQNNLSWTTTAPTVNYSILRDNVAIGTRPPAAITYDDTPITCNTLYTYKALAIYTGGASVSLARNVTSFSNDKPNPVSYLGSEVNAEGSNVALAWPPDVNIKTYHILKGGIKIGSTNSLTYSDDSYTSGNCYKISVENLCGNFSDNSTSPDYCPIALTGSISKSNETTLTWSTYPTVTTYTIEKMDESGAVILTIPGQTSPYVDPAQDTDLQVYSYRITAEGTPLPTISNVYTAVKEPNISYPTAFVSTGSNVPAENGTFRVIGHYVNGFQMRIFNRWGELMFSTENISEGWDGKYHGLQMPEGTYVFTAVLTDELGRKFNRSGSIVLLRK